MHCFCYAAGAAGVLVEGAVIVLRSSQRNATVLLTYSEQ
jgi:hypothetical protein